MAYHLIAGIFREGTLAGSSDRQVLERYVDRGEEIAFETILTRHGPMVLKVCRHLLHDPHDVEDAFQATFLALIRKAASIRIDDSLGPWLYTVANRTATRARANRLRQLREHSQITALEPAVNEAPLCPDTLRVLQEELRRLPDRLRTPLVLCYFTGSTHEMAANQLNCPVGTVRSRLARARALLQKRLTRRGVNLPAGGVISLLEWNSRREAVPLALQRALMKAATRSVTESTSAVLAYGVVSRSGLILLEGALSMMRLKSFTIGVLGMLSVGIVMAILGTTSFSEAGPPVERPNSATKPESLPERPIQGPEHAVYVKTYAVGDLILQHDRPTPNQVTVLHNAPGSKPVVDMMPLIRLIVSTVEPGAWKVFDDDGRDVSEELNLREKSQSASPSPPNGSITPFFLSLSLIVRAEDETHEKVANLLRGLREFNFARENPGKAMPPEEEERLAVRPGKESVGTPPRAKILPQPPSTSLKNSNLRTKIDQLLQELRREIAKLPDDSTP